MIIFQFFFQNSKWLHNYIMYSIIDARRKQFDVGCWKHLALDIYENWDNVACKKVVNLSFGKVSISQPETSFERQTTCSNYSFRTEITFYSYSYILSNTPWITNCLQYETNLDCMIPYIHNFMCYWYNIKRLYNLI